MYDSSIDSKLEVGHRLGALVAPVSAPRVRHLVGLPPELTGESDRREALPAAEVLVISRTSEGYFLDRLARDGRTAGDTWHPSLEEAHDQAIYEFGQAIGTWVVIPEDEAQPAQYVLRRFARPS